jgi:hypothetical protein
MIPKSLGTTGLDNYLPLAKLVLEMEANYAEQNKQNIHYQVNLKMELMKNAQRMMVHFPSPCDTGANIINY